MLLLVNVVPVVSDCTSLGVVGVCIPYSEVLTRFGEFEGIEIGEGVKDKEGVMESPERDRKVAGSSPTFSSSGTCARSDLMCDVDL